MSLYTLSLKDIKGEKYIPSLGEKKVLNALDKFINGDYFQRQVQTLRKKFNIPIFGYKISAENLSDIENNALFHIPLEMGVDKKKTFDILRLINIAIGTIVKEAPLPILDVKYCFKFYLFYNEIIIHKTFNFETDNLCCISDLNADLLDYRVGDDEYLMSCYIDSVKAQNEVYPIAIKIHPEASGRVICDFIEKNLESIKYMQSKYLNSKPRLKTVKGTMPKNKERDRLIYKHRHLPISEIKSLLANKGIYLDDGEIGKIISLEKKRRKEV